MEAPLFRVGRLLLQLEEMHTRTDAAIRVWPETSRTLAPAVNKLESVRGELEELQKELAALWKAGFETKWK